MRFIASFVLFLVVTGCAHAQDGQQYNPYSGPRDGQWLLDLCEPPPNVARPSERIEICMAYSLGIQDGYYATVTAQIRQAVQAGESTNFSLLCNQPQMTLYELRMLVIKFLKAQPDRSGRAHHYVLAALRADAPCAKD